MHVKAKFHVGQLIQHRLFDYRGVVVDVDPCFMASAEPSSTVARAGVTRDNPWYHVLMDGTANWTYVAERNLIADRRQEPVHHPDLSHYFERLAETGYIPLKKGH